MPCSGSCTSAQRRGTTGPKQSPCCGSRGTAGASSSTARRCGPQRTTTPSASRSTSTAKPRDSWGEADVYQGIPFTHGRPDVSRAVADLAACSSPYVFVCGPPGLSAACAAAALEATWPSTHGVRLLIRAVLLVETPADHGRRLRDDIDAAPTVVFNDSDSFSKSASHSLSASQSRVIR